MQLRNGDTVEILIDTPKGKIRLAKTKFEGKLKWFITDPNKSDFEDENKPWSKEVLKWEFENDKNHYHYTPLNDMGRKEGYYWVKPSAFGNWAIYFYSTNNGGYWVGIDNHQKHNDRDFHQINEMIIELK